MKVCSFYNKAISKTLFCGMNTFDGSHNLVCTFVARLAHILKVQRSQVSITPWRLSELKRLWTDHYGEKHQRRIVNTTSTYDIYLTPPAALANNYYSRAKLINNIFAALQSSYFCPNSLLSYKSLMWPKKNGWYTSVGNTRSSDFILSVYWRMGSIKICIMDQ